MSKFRVNFYVDGFNLYHGICDTNRKELLWLDLVSLIQSVISKKERLHRIKYFTTIPTGNIKDKIKRHRIWLELLSSLSFPIEIYQGKFYYFPITCKDCGRTFKQRSEKRTDVNIATHLLCDTFKGDFETAYILSADSDLVPAIETAKIEFPLKQFKFVFPPKRFSYDLKKLADYLKAMKVKDLIPHVAPTKITTISGKIIEKPNEWI